MLWLAIGFGGAVGSIARHAANVWTHRIVGDTVPHATAIVNVVGCGLIGALAGLSATGTLRLPEPARAFLFVGILGGFTTFSSFGLDTLTLVRAGATGLAAANVAVQLGLGLGSVFVGYWLATAR
jgi:CrcB protein